MSYIDLALQTGDAPASPAGYFRLFAKSDGLYLIDNSSPAIVLGPLTFNPFIWPTAQTTTISGGIILAPGMHIAIDTQGAASSDDLDTITAQTTFPIFNFILIRPASDVRSIVVKHGTGNIVLSGGADITLDDITDHLLLFYDGTQWVNLQ